MMIIAFTCQCNDCKGWYDLDQPSCAAGETGDANSSKEDVAFSPPNFSSSDPNFSLLHILYLHSSYVTLNGDFHCLTRQNNYFHEIA